tara:strand:- start:673 stop:1068 length:396 start_codon:yes stop_codon:yes gene_type:complete
MQTIIISTVIALALWAIFAKLFKFTREQVSTLLENKANRKRKEERIAIKKEREERIMLLSNRLCRENEYLTKLVYYFRSLPQQKKENKTSPTWLLSEHIRAQIQKQVKRTMSATDYNYYGEVINHLIGKFK